MLCNTVDTLHWLHKRKRKAEKREREIYVTKQNETFWKGFICWCLFPCTGFSAWFWKCRLTVTGTLQQPKWIQTDRLLTPSFPKRGYCTDIFSMFVFSLGGIYTHHTAKVPQWFCTNRWKAICHLLLLYCWFWRGKSSVSSMNHDHNCHNMLSKDHK